ncbi:MAG: tetratricopeptide repeat protein [Bacteroidetes bacterium]|jgi:hypothetical protein|nr:tetratricopeptide repeat protein [Bacteroidota bacterium]
MHWIGARRIALMAALTCWSMVAMAELPDSAFVRASDLYRAGAFAESARMYESIVQRELVSGEVYFNLGNAYYRDGNVGRAILAFERAARLLPTDDDVAHNLRLARLRAVDRIDPVPEFFLVAWLRSVSEVLSPAVSRMLFLAFWTIVFASLVALYLARTAAVVQWSRITFFAAVPLAVLFGALWLAQMTALSEDHSGIVLTPTVTVRSSPDANAVDAFVIHEGLKVEVGLTVDGWTRILLADGKVGWVREGDVEKI